jgi:hypothetical protein
MISFSKFLSRRDSEVYKEIFDTYSKPRLDGFGHPYVNIFIDPNKRNYFRVFLSVAGETGLRGAQDVQKANVTSYNSYGNEEKHKVNYAGREDHNHKFEKSPKEFIYSHTILLFSILQVWHDG